MPVSDLTNVLSVDGDRFVQYRNSKVVQVVTDLSYRRQGTEIPSQESNDQDDKLNWQLLTGAARFIILDLFVDYRIPPIINSWFWATGSSAILFSLRRTTYEWFSFIAMWTIEERWKGQKMRCETSRPL